MMDKEYVLEKLATSNSNKTLIEDILKLIRSVNEPKTIFVKTKAEQGLKTIASSSTKKPILKL